MGYKIFYVAEILDDNISQQEAEARVLLNRHLLTHYTTTKHESGSTKYSTQTGKLSWKNPQDLKILIDILELDETLFKNINLTKMLCLYKNRSKNTAVFRAPHVKSSFSFIFYVPKDIEELKIVKCFDSPTVSLVPNIVANFINMDMMGKNDSANWKSKDKF